MCYCQVKSLEKRAGDLVRGSMARFRGIASVVRPVLGRLPGSNDLRGALQMSGVQDTADMEH